MFNIKRLHQCNFELMLITPISKLLKNKLYLFLLRLNSSSKNSSLKKILKNVNWFFNKNNYKKQMLDADKIIDKYNNF